MRCAYCKQPCKVYANYDRDYEDYDIDVNGMNILVQIHDKCLPKILSQWINGKIHPVLYGTPYEGTTSVTSDTVECTKEMDG